MSFLGLNKRRIRVIGSALMAVIIMLLIILVLPALGTGFDPTLSSGTTGEGGGFSIQGVYR
jgi:hypothetical protein